MENLEKNQRSAYEQCYYENNIYKKVEKVKKQSEQIMLILLAGKKRCKMSKLKR